MLFTLVKASYYRLALIHHPDKVGNEDKATAAEKFDNLHRAYTILSDVHAKKVYASVREKFIDRKMGPRSKYQNSVEEENDILREFVKGNGSMTHIFNVIPFIHFDENRVTQIIKTGIAMGKISKILIRKMYNRK